MISKVGRLVDRSPATIVDFGFPNSFKTEPWLSGGRKGGKKRAFKYLCQNAQHVD
jgi:hypothetical protein